MTFGVAHIPSKGHFSLDLQLHVGFADGALGLLMILTYYL